MSEEITESHQTGGDSQMLSYKFNQYRVSGEVKSEWSALAMELVRVEAGLFTGQQMGQVLYQHYVEGKTVKEVNKNSMGMAFTTVKSIIKGKYSPEASMIFNLMLEQDPGMLDILFKVVVTNEK